MHNLYFLERNRFWPILTLYLNLYAPYLSKSTFRYLLVLSTFSFFVVKNNLFWRRFWFKSASIHVTSMGQKCVALDLTRSQRPWISFTSSTALKTGFPLQKALRNTILQNKRVQISQHFSPKAHNYRTHICNFGTFSLFQFYLLFYTLDCQYFLHILNAI